MTGQPRPSNATELSKSMMRQSQIEIDLGNQKGKDTPEGLSHLTRAQNIKSQLIRFQQQMHRQQSMQQQQQQQQQQHSQQGQQNQSQSGTSQSQNAMGMLSNSGSPVNNGQNIPNAPMNAGTPTPAQQQAQQIRLAQFAQLNQLKQQQLRAQGMSPQPGATAGGVNQNLGVPQQQQPQQQQQMNQVNQASMSNQPVSGQTTINMNSANGMQQRTADLDMVRRVLAQLSARLEQAQTALQYKTDPTEVKRLQGQIAYYRNQQTVAKQKEMMLMREMRIILEQQQHQTQQQAQQPGNTQQPQQQPNQGQQPAMPASRAPQGQQTAAMMQSQMLRGIPRNQNGQPMTAAQINAARQAQLRTLQSMGQTTGTNATVGGNAASAAAAAAAGTGTTPNFNGTPAGANGPPASADNTSGANSALANAAAKTKVTGAADQIKTGAVVPSPNRYLAQSLPIPHHLNVQSPQPLPVRPGRPTLTNGGATDAQASNSPALVRPPTMDLSGDRALSKRKLSDLVTSVMGDDNEPSIDGDVEELLLDSADEFVSSVTSFACKLAKHRKSEVLEAKDIHMHLERNWNMHIAGYSSDEVRSIRRFMPTQTYQQKLQGISMAKTMNK